MIHKSKEINYYNFINNKWRFFKDWLREFYRCYFIKDLEIDEVSKTFTFRNVYKRQGIKLEGKDIYEGIWEEEKTEGENVVITAYVRKLEQNKSNVKGE